MDRVKQHVARHLHTAGKRFGVNANKLAKNSFLVTVSHGVSILRGLMTGYLVARLFPRDLYGQYQLVLTVMGTLGAVGISDLYKAVARAFARGKPAAVRPVARYQLLWCATESVLLLCALPFLSHFGREELVWPFVLAAIIFPITQVSGVLLHSVTVGGQNFRLALNVNTVTTLLVVIGMLFPLFVYPSITLLLLVTTGIPAAVALFASLSRVPKSNDTKTAKEVFWYGVQLTLLNAPVTLSWYLDKFLVSQYYGLNQLAVFSVALLLPEQLKVFAGELLPVTFASQARGEDSMARRFKLMGFVGAFTVLFGLLLGAYIVAAPWVFAWFFPNYPDAIFYTQLAAAMLITVPCGLLTQYLEAQAMVRALRYTRWLAAIVFCVSLVTLVPQFGVAGPLWARGILRLTYALCVLFFLFTAPVHHGKKDEVATEPVTP